MLKRAGRGHDPAGVAATKPGSLAVECPACPHDGRNLPENWKSVPMAIAYVFLYAYQTYNVCSLVVIVGSTPFTSQWMLTSA
jgi:hypothetical protein